MSHQKTLNMRTNLKTLIAVLLLLLLSIAVLSCKDDKQAPGVLGKTDKQKEEKVEGKENEAVDNKGSLEGKWLFDDLEYTDANERYQRMNPKEKQEKMEEILGEARGTIFEFRDDNSYKIVDGKDGKIINGTWALGKSGQLTMIEDGKTKEESALVSFPSKNLLRLDINSEGMIIRLKKVD